MTTITESALLERAKVALRGFAFTDDEAVAKQHQKDFEAAMLALFEMEYARQFRLQGRMQ